jgi:hypothetical protein
MIPIMSVVNAAEAVLGKGALAGTFLPASGSINGDGISARSGTVPTEAMRCKARMAFVLWATRNQQRDIDLNLQKGRASQPQTGFGVDRPVTRRNVVAEPGKKQIEARAYQLWEQAGRPKDRETEFWHLAEQELRNEDKASPIRTPDTL